MNDAERWISEHRMVQLRLIVWDKPVEDDGRLMCLTVDQAFDLINHRTQMLPVIWNEHY